MKKLLLAIFGICCCASLFAATGVTTPDGWTDDFAAAREESKKTGRPILILFTGSDWCPYCVKLKQHALDKKDFKSYADKRLILVYADFPNHVKLPDDLKERNMKLAKQYGVRGFPTTIIIGPDGGELGRLSGYSHEYLKRVRRFLKKH